LPKDFFLLVRRWGLTPVVRRPVKTWYQCARSDGQWQRLLGGSSLLGLRHEI